MDRAAVAEALPAYEVGEELGRGAWGIVLAGHHRHLRRDVAIKQLPPVFALDPSVRARFAGEARLLASLDHPHIVPVYDYVERDGLCLLVMEKLSGGTVWSRFREPGLGVEAACAVSLVTAGALKYAHDRGVLHRDIKPENLLFSHDGAVLKVADFGIAKVLTGGRTMATSAGTVLGTPSYMAPEQARGEDATPATDIYALGVTLFRLLSGRLPFEEAESPLAALYLRAHLPPKELGEVAPRVAPPLRDVVMRAIAPATGDRYADAEDFGVALAEAATSALGDDWLDRSGLRATLWGRLAAVTVGAAGARAGPPGARSEQAGSGEHERKEAALLEQLRAGMFKLEPDERADAERLLGAQGAAPQDRLGLAADAGTARISAAAIEQASRWRRRAEHPLTPRALVHACQLLVRTCEGILGALGGAGGRQA